MIMCEITEEPTGKVYTSLIEYAIDTSDVFMCVACDYYAEESYAKNVLPFLDELQPYKIKTRNNAYWSELEPTYDWSKGLPQIEPFSWPGTETYDRHKHDIYFYKSCPELKQIICKPGGLYKWVYSLYPEDPCFFRNGYCWFATTAHEEISYIYPRDEKEASILKSMGIKFDKVDSVDGKLYFEEF